MSNTVNELLQIIDEYLDDFADAVIEKASQNLVDMNKIDRGLLLKSGDVNRAFLDKEIVFGVPYADAVEFGQEPGSMPPPQSLEKWIRRKLGVTNPKEIRQVSFAIAQKIKQKGIQPAPYLFPAAVTVEKDFRGKV
jgi:hypothetical protein